MLGRATGVLGHREEVWKPREAKGHCRKAVAPDSFHLEAHPEVSEYAGSCLNTS